MLRGVGFEAGRARWWRSSGPTGAGKSTLAGLLPRFFDPDRGVVRLDGRDLRGLRLESVRAQCRFGVAGVVPVPVLDRGEHRLWAPGREPGGDRGGGARRRARTSSSSRLPDGYDTLVGERGATLSGGERQRVAIARALLKDAPVLVLDEPTSALDAETERSLLAALERLMAGRTTLVIAHRLSTIRRADRILVLRAGEIVERGSHDELIALGGAYAHMHAIQHGAKVS